MTPLKIAVNTRFLIKNKLEGIGWFTHETLKRITSDHPDVEFHFLFDRKYDPDFIFSENVIPHVLMPQARHPVLWKWWFDISVPSALKKIKPDLFISTDGFLSLKAKIPQLLVVHDLAFEHFDDHVGRIARNYYRDYSPKYARKAARIATVSEFSKQDLVKLYGIDPDKIDVVYNGANEIYSPLGAVEIARVKNEYAHGFDYFLYAGSIHPRKNINNLLKAFDMFKQRSGSNVKLILAGRKAWSYEQIMNTYRDLKYRTDVIFQGHLTQLELSLLIGGAMAMTYVSLFEGFGIPIIEAQRCEVPVITSSTSSMIEVGGDAVLFVDPTSIEDISNAMTVMESDESLRKDLIERGKVQCRKFSWEITAEKLWASVTKVLDTLD